MNRHITILLALLVFFTGCKTIYSASSVESLPVLVEGKHYSVTSSSGVKRNGKYIGMESDQLWFKFKKHNSFIKSSQIDVIKQSISPGGRVAIVLGSIVVGFLVFSLIYALFGSMTISIPFGT